MIPNSSVDTGHVESQNPYGIKQNLYILKYSPGVETAKESLVSSAIEPFNLYDTLAKETTYFTIPDTPSDTSVVIPEMPWFINDKSAKTLIYQKQLHPSDDLTWISSRKAVSPKWTIKEQEQYDQIFNRVVQLFDLPEDWDSYGGNVIEKHCIDRAVKILKYLIELRDRTGISAPVPFVSPLSSGGIQIEWEEKERYLELSFLPESSEIEYFVSDRTNAGELSLEGLMKSIKNLDELLLWFIRGKAEDLGLLNFENFYSES
jgi:hypothetical protein